MDSPGYVDETKFRLFHTETMEQVSLSLTAYTHQGQRDRMEDFISIHYYTVDAETPIFPGNGETVCSYMYVGVFDGHGGTDAARYAKENLLATISAEAGFLSDDDEAMCQAMRNGFKKLHSNMEESRASWPLRKSGSLSTAGTTASIAIIFNNKLYTANVGDCRIVLGIGDVGDQRPWISADLTDDHKPDHFEEKTRIEESGGHVINSRVAWTRPSNPIVCQPFLWVSRALGDYWSYNPSTNSYAVSPEPDVRVTPLNPKIHRSLLIASDGVWGVVTSFQAIQFTQNCVAKYPQTNPACELTHRALLSWNKAGKRADNTTLVTILFDGPEPSFTSNRSPKKKRMLK